MHFYNTMIPEHSHALHHAVPSMLTVRPAQDKLQLDQCLLPSVQLAHMVLIYSIQPHVLPALPLACNVHLLQIVPHAHLPSSS
jgi:hypothetical protein